VKFYLFTAKETNFDTIVNMKTIETIEPFGGDSVITFRSGRELVVIKDFKSMEHIIGGMNG
jgi:uncharacterized protein YlzI (FlbEa/FlbD family)